ncbi:MAG UNVERIFIED_CONTAM: DUF4352 domain-containing protein [Thermobifida fusca]|mgnify:CR=1 FL=1|jgi:hypothetical protein
MNAGEPGFRRTWRTGGAAVTVLVVATVLVGCATEADGPAITAIDEPAAPETTEQATTTERTTTTAEPTTTTTEASTSTTAPEEEEVDTAGSSAGDQEVYAIGEWAHTSGFDVTVHQVQDPYTSPNEFDTPDPGHRYVAVEVEVRNTTDDRRTFSTFDAEVIDSMHRPWDTALAGFELPNVDGDVPPGGARRGWIVFEVAEDSTDLILRVKGSLTATGSLFALG